VPLLFLLFVVAVILTAPPVLLGMVKMWVLLELQVLVLVLLVLVMSEVHVQVVNLLHLTYARSGQRTENQRNDQRLWPCFELSRGH
jgi:heme/copper-type cytochrome/quinol oxidase subunit 4